MARVSVNMKVIGEEKSMDKVLVHIMDTKLDSLILLVSGAVVGFPIQLQSALAQMPYADFVAVDKPLAKVLKGTTLSDQYGSSVAVSSANERWPGAIDEIKKAWKEANA